MWIFLAIFFGIIFILVIVAIVGSKKDKNEKMVEADKVDKQTTRSNDGRIKIFASLNKLISNLEKELENFQPSVGVKSLGDINKFYTNEIKAISHSNELKDVYKIPDYKIELEPIINELFKSKPSNWSKDAQFSINLVLVKVEAMKKLGNYEKKIIEGEKIKWAKAN